MPSPAAPSTNRQVVALAVPTLGALLAEPVFLLVDAAVVGHLGTAQLAGVGIASVLLSTAVGLAVFLAYGTTAQVARSLGAGRERDALQFGVAGMWLAALVGAGLLLVGWPLAPLLVDALGGRAAEAGAAGFGVTYLRWSLLGLPGMLLVLAGTGVLRGFQDARTPLVVAVTGAVVNTGLNLVLVLVVGWGVAGAAIGTAVTQTGMAVAFVLVVHRSARRSGGSLRFHPGHVRGAGRAGVPLLLRTAALRGAVLLTTLVAARQGVVALAAHQVLTAIWNFLALGLDALAIAAQALTGRALGAGDAAEVRRLTRLLLRWGLAAGAVLTVVLLVLHTLIGPLFSPDPAVRSAIAAGLVVLAVTQPLAGWVFVLDGVLIGAGDGVYLAWAQLMTLAAYVPAVVALILWPPGGTAGLVWLWIAFAGWFMLARAITLGLRYRSDRWLVTGAG
ncbi:MATE family efflux transporter [Nakamurella leprariae]|uniref:MATE family efflux transporter n=1 Tax=Nakamurella leprariae TaxID=2803911 RepID=A0A939BY06_9ACTN|nr:MATE family efflux transporter [Nakamurella leprariae]MBM9469088.1 MATE family efflux transporter [Nakamurella leprariae]